MILLVVRIFRYRAVSNSASSGRLLYSTGPGCGVVPTSTPSAPGSTSVRKTHYSIGTSDVHSRFFLRRLLLAHEPIYWRTIYGRWADNARPALPITRTCTEYAISSRATTEVHTMLTRPRPKGTCALMGARGAIEFHIINGLVPPKMRGLPAKSTLLLQLCHTRLTQSTQTVQYKPKAPYTQTDL